MRHPYSGDILLHAECPATSPQVHRHRMPAAVPEYAAQQCYTLQLGIRMSAPLFYECSAVLSHCTSGFHMYCTPLVKMLL